MKETASRVTGSLYAGLTPLVSASVEDAMAAAALVGALAILAIFEDRRAAAIAARTKHR